MSEVALKQGSVGDKVAQLQKALYAMGFNPNEFDGFFGPGTEAATRAFQESMKLAGDGVVDKQTWDHILRITWTGTDEPVTLYRNPENPYQRHLLPDVSDESENRAE